MRSITCSNYPQILIIGLSSVATPTKIICGHGSATTVSLRKISGFSFVAARELEYDTLKSLQLETGYGKSFCFTLLQLLFDCLYQLQGDCCGCFPKKNFHPDSACFLATRLPVESGPSFLRSLDDFEMSFAQPM